MRALRMLPVLAMAGCAHAGWVLSHEETFAGNTPLNLGFWEFETGHLRNQERQYYLARNVSVQDGVLRFEARREQVPNAQHRPGATQWRSRHPTAQYTSGSIVSRGTLHHGRIEIVARSPSGAGVWPAIWLVHESPGRYGEIDVYEAVGKHPDTAFAGVHWGREPRTRKHLNASRHVPGLEGSWRTHTIEWTPDRIAISLDGAPLFSFDPRDAAIDGSSPLSAPMKLHLNLALGGTWAGPIDDRRLPARFEVASIRMWRWDPSASPGATAAGGPRPAAPAAEPEPVMTPRWGR